MTYVSALTGDELLKIVSIQSNGMPAGTLNTTTTGAIAALAESLDSTPTIITALNTVGAGTITAAGIAGGVTLRGGSQSASPFTDTTATAALIIAALPAPATIGNSFIYTYNNNTDAVATITGGVGVTVSVNTTVQPNMSAQFLVTYTAANTVTMVGIGVEIYNPANAETLAGALNVTGKTTLSDVLQFGATATAAIKMGAGTSATPVAMGSTATNLLGFWGETTATTGDSRGMYLRLYFEGAGGSGEAARIFGSVNNVTAATGGTVNGAHVSLSIDGASGTVSGAGNALRATLSQGASNATGGTLSVIQVDSDLDNSATVPATMSYLRFTNSNTKKVPIFMNLDGVDTSTLYLAAGTSAGSAGDADNCAAQQVLHIKVNGADCYIPVFTQNS